MKSFKMKVRRIISEIIDSKITFYLKNGLDVFYENNHYLTIIWTGDISYINCLLHASLSSDIKKKIYYKIIKPIRAIKTIEVSSVFKKVHSIEYLHHNINRYISEYSQKDSRFLKKVFSNESLKSVDDGYLPSTPDAIVGKKYIIEHTKVNSCKDNQEYHKVLAKIHESFYDSSKVQSSYVFEQNVENHIINIKKAMKTKNDKYLNYVNTLGSDYSKAKLVLLIEETTNSFLFKTGAVPNPIIIDEILDFWKNNCGNISYIAYFHDGVLFVHSLKDIAKLIANRIESTNFDVTYGNVIKVVSAC